MVLFVWVVWGWTGQLFVVVGFYFIVALLF